jgi:hypothetical protein
MVSTLPSIEHNRRLSEQERARFGRELLARYQAGMSIRQLCADTGYSIGRVRRLLAVAGVEFRGRGRGSTGGSNGTG